jgi:uncharacterized protein YbcV (DUF1398 family)
MRGHDESEPEQMNDAIENLNAAKRRALQLRPRVAGFPVLAEVLRQAGVTRNRWELPSCQALYVTALGNVVEQGEPLLAGTAAVPRFDEAALIRALRTDQAGDSSFPQFLRSSWEAGVVSYDVELLARNVIYRGAGGESYREDYPAVEL